MTKVNLDRQNFKQDQGGREPGEERPGRKGITWSNSPEFKITKPNEGGNVPSHFHIEGHAGWPGTWSDGFDDEYAVIASPTSVEVSINDGPFQRALISPEFDKVSLWSYGAEINLEGTHTIKVKAKWKTPSKSSERSMKVVTESALPQI